MPRKEKKRDQLRGDAQAKDFLNDYLAQIQDKTERKKIKEALKKGTLEAEQKVRELKAELDLVRGQLKIENEKRRKAEEILEKREPLLTERVKEISCLYSVVSLLANTEYPSADAKLQDIVNLIPTGWQYPQDTCARIVFAGKEYRTSNFQETLWHQTAGILVNGQPAGILDVRFLQEKPCKEEGPFLLEERTLIDIIAKIVGEMMS